MTTGTIDIALTTTSFGTQTMQKVGSAQINLVPTLGSFVSPNNQPKFWPSSGFSSNVHFYSGGFYGAYGGYLADASWTTADNRGVRQFVGINAFQALNGQFHDVSSISPILQADPSTNNVGTFGGTGSFGVGVGRNAIYAASWNPEAIDTSFRVVQSSSLFPALTFQNLSYQFSAYQFGGQFWTTGSEYSSYSGVVTLIDQYANEIPIGFYPDSLSGEHFSFIAKTVNNSPYFLNFLNFPNPIPIPQIVNVNNNTNMVCLNPDAGNLSPTTVGAEVNPTTGNMFGFRGDGTYSLMFWNIYVPTTITYSIPSTTYTCTGTTATPVLLSFSDSGDQANWIANRVGASVQGLPGGGWIICLGINNTPGSNTIFVVNESATKYVAITPTYLGLQNPTGAVGNFRVDVNGFIYALEYGGTSFVRAYSTFNLSNTIELELPYLIQWANECRIINPCAQSFLF